MSFNLRPGTSLFGNITFTPGTNENYVAPPTHGSVNVALTATSTASTHISDRPPSLAHDGIIGISDTDGSTISNLNAWVTTGEGVGAWMQLDWSTPQTVNKIKLYDRPNVTHDHIKGGTLTFSDGSSVTVGELPDGVVNGAPDPLEVTFDAKTITWVRFTVNAFTGHNAGLTEFEVWSVLAAPEPAPEQESLVELYLNATDSGVVDSSSNSHQLTAHSSISVVNDSPYNNETSIAFDGNGDYLTIPTSDSTVIGSGDFTFETWIKFDTIEFQNRYLRIAEAGPYTDSTGTWRLGTTGQNTQLGLTFSGTSINSNDHLSLNQWHHVAVSRSGTTVAMFINGVKQTQTMSSSANIDTALTHIGTQVTPETWFHGEMADLRLVKGTAVYTETFTLPTEELTAVTGTSLLISGNGGISDASPSSHTLSTYGNVTTTSDSPYSTGKSMGFNGNYLTTTDGVDFSDNDFTIELWWYPTSTGRQGLFHGSAGADWSIGIDYNSTYNNPTLGFWASSNGSTWDLVNSDPGGNGVTTGEPVQNAWNHIAYVRNGSTLTLYLNGVNVGEVTGVTASIHDKTTTHGMSIGTWWKATGWGGGPMSGNVADYRITLDAVYTENFSVPTEPVGDYTVDAPSIVTEGLVFHVDAGNTSSYSGSGTTWTDLAGSNDATLVNGVTYDNGSMVFDGVDNYVTVPSTLTIGDTFTYSAWIKADSLTGRSAIFSTRNPNSGNGLWQLEVGEANGPNRVGISIPGVWAYTSSDNVISTNTWHYITVVKADASTNFQVFVDGVSQGFASQSVSTSGNNNTRVIGAGVNAIYDFFDGRMGSIVMYDKALTEAEILFNYNASKDRY